MHSTPSSKPEINNLDGSRSRNRLKWIIIIGFWTFFGLLTATQLYLGLRREGLNLPLWRVIGANLFGWWPWIPGTAIVLALGRRFPVERGRLWRTLPIHLVAAILITIGQFTAFTYSMLMFAPFGPERTARSFFELLLGRAMSQFHISLIIYAAILGLGYAVRYYFRFREGEYRAAQLETRLAQAQLQTLKMQLQPHFLFNTLNGIAGLVRDSRNKAAVDMLAGLSDLLRYTLENAGKQEVPLKEELEFLELYLDIQQMRFSDRLTVDMKVMPETLDAMVPNLILQPLVENAIRHGISRRAAAGTVGVNAERDDGLLRITIYDDGPGLEAGGRPVEGVGLSNTRARLEQLYGDRQRFTIANRQGGGCEVSLVMPFRRLT
ncbi:MAG TPA: histidine kinase [Pyrinomonadaceae bacterium]|nr:histidine kinase [Pyrinomonadaceae bacterium]